MKTVDINNWKRKNQYLNFIGYSNPVFSMGAQLDVTELVEYCENAKKQFFTLFLYVALNELNKIDELKTRIKDGEVVIYDCVSPSFVVLKAGGELVTCRTEFSDFESFYQNNRSDINAAKNSKSVEWVNSEAGTDCVYVSCIPWVNLVSFSNSYDLNNPGQTSIPRITWGKYEKNKNRYTMYFDISAHHALADGKHASSLINGIQQAVSNINTYLEERNER